MPWWLPALIGSLFSAYSAEVNRRYKMGGRRLNLWSLSLSAIILAPIMILAPWPTSIEFYLVAIANGIIMGFAGIPLLRLSADYNGRIASLINPIKVIISFFIWVGYKAILSLPIFESTAEIFGVIIVLLTITFAFFYMVKEKVNLLIIGHILPFSLLFALADVGIKLVMLEGIYYSFVFVFLATLSGALTLVAFMIYRGKKKALWSPKLLKAGSILATCGVCSMIGLVTSIQIADNPAYPAIVMLLSSAWLLTYYRIRKIPDNISPVSGTLIVISAMFLILLTRG